MAIFDLFRLDGEVALITGGGGGLGSAIARAYAEAGADIAVVGRTPAALRKVAADIEQRGRRCAVIAADLTDAGAADAIVSDAVAALGKLSILVNNVGGLGDGDIDQQMRPVLDLSEDAWLSQMDLNLNSVRRVTRAAVPRMSEGGVILNMSSIKAFRPAGGSGAYAAAKAAMNLMTAALAIDLAPRFRVNGIAPGPVPTEAFRAARGIDEADYAAVAEEWGVPLGRVGRPDDVAAAALYLASPAGSWITGQTLIVAGGL